MPTFSPWRRSVSPTKLTVLIRFANTNTRDLDLPSFLRKSVTCLSSLRAFLCSAQTCTVCSTLLTSTAPSPPFPPAATATFASFDRFPSPDLSADSIFTMAGFGASHVLATARTVLGKVALKSNVWRPSLRPIPGASAPFPSPSTSPASRSLPGSAFRITSS